MYSQVSHSTSSVSDVNEVRTSEGVRRFGDTRFVADDLLRAKRETSRIFGRQRVLRQSRWCEAIACRPSPPPSPAPQLAPRC